MRPTKAQIKRKLKKTSKIGYMCGVSYQHELDEDNAHEVELFGSIRALKKKMKCTHECGIVKVKVTLQKWERVQDLTKAGDND